MHSLLLFIVLSSQSLNLNERRVELYLELLSAFAGKLLDKQSLLVGGAEACAVTAMAFDSTSQLLAVALGRCL